MTPRQGCGNASACLPSVLLPPEVGILLSLWPSEHWAGSPGRETGARGIEDPQALRWEPGRGRVPRPQEGGAGPVGRGVPRR